MAKFKNDDSLKTIFEHIRASIHNAVFVTYINHLAHVHPDADKDMVKYAHGRLLLTDDRKKMEGVLELWHNKISLGINQPFHPFTKQNDGKRTIFISLSDDGTLSTQERLEGNPVMGMPVQKIPATYTAGLFVHHNSAGNLVSTSFTLGEVIIPG